MCFVLHCFIFNYIIVVNFGFNDLGSRNLVFIKANVMKWVDYIKVNVFTNHYKIEKDKEMWSNTKIGTTFENLRIKEIAKRMCYRVDCKQCGKYSWGGCGEHLSALYASIDEGNRCMCRSWPGVVTPSTSNVTISQTAAATTTINNQQLQLQVLVFLWFLIFLEVVFTWE